MAKTDTPINVMSDKALEESNIVTFDKPYQFEGVEYTSIDLSNVVNMKSADMVAVEKAMVQNGSNLDALPQLKMEYSCYMAARLTNQPVEFFLGLPAREANKVKNRVTNFLF